jgi:hypothetical protein
MRYSNKTKKRRGGSKITGNFTKKFNNVKPGSILGDSARNVVNTGIVALRGSTRLALGATKLTMKTANASIQTASIVIQGTLAVVSGIFGSLKSMFSTLPKEFDAIVRALQTETNDNLKIKLSRKLLNLFEGTTHNSQLKFEQLFTQFTNMNNRLRSQISFQFGESGCKRTRVNGMIRNRFAHSNCKGFNGNKTSANKALTLLINRLNKIKSDLKLNYVELKTTNKKFLIDLNDAVTKKSGSTSLESFMDKYEAAINPIIENSEVLLSNENPDIVNLTAEFTRALLPKNAANAIGAQANGAQANAIGAQANAIGAESIGAQANVNTNGAQANGAQANANTIGAQETINPILIRNRIMAGVNSIREP